MSDPVARIRLYNQSRVAGETQYGTLVVHEEGALYFLDTKGNQIAQVNLFVLETDEDGRCLHADVDVIIEDDMRVAPLAWSQKEGKVLDPRSGDGYDAVFKPEALLEHSRVIGVDITRR